MFCCQERLSGPGWVRLWVLRPVSGVTRAGCGAGAGPLAGRILCSAGVSRGGGEVSDPSLSVLLLTTISTDIRRWGHRPALPGEYNNNIGTNRDETPGTLVCCWHRTMVMLKLTKTWELYWSGPMNYAGSSLTELSGNIKILCPTDCRWKLTMNLFPIKSHNQTFWSSYC